MLHRLCLKNDYLLHVHISLYNNFAAEPRPPRMHAEGESAHVPIYHLKHMYLYIT